MMRVGIAVALVTAVGCAHPGKPLPSPPTHSPTGGESFRVHVIDVGTGLSVFVRGADFALLYDAGSVDDVAVGAGNRTLAYLRAVEPGLQRIDHVILSHPHEDHVLLLADVLRAYRIGTVYDSGDLNAICAYQRFLEAVVASGASYRTAAHEPGTHRASFAAGACRGRGGPVGVSVRTGERIVAPHRVRLGADASMTFLYADGADHPDDYNKNSLVVRLDLGGASVLLMGDSQGGERADPGQPPRARSIEAALLACCREALRADVLVAGHHGSKTSSRRAFVDAVAPAVAVISSGPHPYRSVVLPDPEIVDELQTRCPLYRTDRDDAGCLASTHKIGPANDQRPGGCDNIQISIDRGQIGSPTYWSGH